MTRVPPAPPAPALPAGRLPVLGTVGDLPPEPGRLVVEVDAASRIFVDGKEIPFEALQELLRRRADETRQDVGGKPSTLDVVLRVDRDLPWTRALRLMEACALPETRIYRIHFAALPEGGGEEGAFATFLAGGPRPDDGDPSARAPGPVSVPLRLSPDPTGTTVLDRDLLPFLGTTWTDLGWSSIQVTFDAAPETPAGVALRAVETILRSGVDSVVFRCPASSEATTDPAVSAGSPRGWAVTVFDSPMAPFTGALPPLPPPGRITGRAAGQTLSPVADSHPHHASPPPGSAAARAARAAALGAGGGEGTEEAVEAALDWLARHQSPNGAWDVERFEAECKIAKCGGAGRGMYTPGVTGLALAAFLGHGETHKTPIRGAVVRNGLKYLKGIQDVAGRFGVSSAVEGTFPRFALLMDSDHAIYNHPLATLAMVEAWERTRSPLFKESAERAVAFILRAQNPYLGWRYGERPQDSDTSVTAWMALALHAAERAGLDVDPAGLEGAAAWIDRVTDPETGRAGYSARGNGPARAQELLDRFPPDRSESTTAMAVLVRLLAGAPPDDAEVLRGADLCLRVPPSWDDAAGSVDHVYWFFGTNALFRVGGDRWKAWNGPLKTALVGNRRVDRAEDRYGSWDPVDPWSKEGGRVCATALNALTLETYYGEEPSMEDR